MIKLLRINNSNFFFSRPTIQNSLARFSTTKVTNRFINDIDLFKMSNDLKNEWWNKVKSKTEHAIKVGALQTIETTTQYADDGGVKVPI